jgi:hypothetical protein
VTQLVANAAVRSAGVESFQVIILHEEPDVSGMVYWPTLRLDSIRTLAQVMGGEETASTIRQMGYKGVCHVSSAATSFNLVVTLAGTLLCICSSGQATSALLSSGHFAAVLTQPVSGQAVIDYISTLAKNAPAVNPSTPSGSQSYPSPSSP